MYKLNRIVLVMSLFLITQLSSCQKKMENYKTEKLEWEGQGTAPEDYPVIIMSPNIFYSDKGKFISQIPNMSYEHGGWGLVGGGWETVASPMPDHLSIVWYSHTENKIYQGEFELPQEKLYKLFKEGYMIYGQRPGGTDGKEDFHKETYNALLAGVAPEGMVVVWAVGQNRIEIGRFQAHELTRNDANKLYNNQFKDGDMPETIVQAQLDRLTPKVQQEIKENKVTSKQWDDYRLRYNWKIESNQPFEVYSYYVRYFNGEMTGYIPPLMTREKFNKNILETQSKTIPRIIGMYVTTKDGVNRLIRVESFDENEIIEAFKKMNEASENHPISIFFDIDNDFTKAKITLKNDKKEIVLKKDTIKLFKLNKTNDRKNEQK